MSPDIKSFDDLRLVVVENPQTKRTAFALSPEYTQPKPTPKRGDPVKKKLVFAAEEEDPEIKLNIIDVGSAEWRQAKVARGEDPDAEQMVMQMRNLRLETREQSRQRLEEDKRRLFERMAEERMPKVYEDPFKKAAPVVMKGEGKRETGVVIFDDDEIDGFLNTAIGRSIKKVTTSYNITPKTPGVMFLALYMSASPVTSRNFRGAWRVLSNQHLEGDINIRVGDDLYFSFMVDSPEVIKGELYPYQMGPLKLGDAKMLFAIDPKRKTLEHVSGTRYKANYPPGITTIVVAMATDGAVDVEYSDVVILKFV